MSTTVTGTDKQFNYLSCSQNIWAWFSGSPRQQTLEKAPFLSTLLPENPTQYDAILKIADESQDLTILEVDVAQGHEDAVNIANKANHIYLTGRYGIRGTGQRVITVKGGVTVVIINGVIWGRGSLCDVQIGDWMDQTDLPCSDIFLNSLRHVDGRPVRVIKNFRDKAALGVNCKLMLWKSIQLTAYWYFKWIVRKLLRIPLGQSGPAWLS